MITRDWGSDKRPILKPLLDKGFRLHTTPGVLRDVVVCAVCGLIRRTTLAVRRAPCAPFP